MKSLLHRSRKEGQLSVGRTCVCAVLLWLWCSSGSVRPVKVLLTKTEKKIQWNLRKAQSRNPLQPTQREGRLKKPPNRNGKEPGQGQFARETVKKPPTGMHPFWEPESGSTAGGGGKRKNPMRAIFSQPQGDSGGGETWGWERAAGAAGVTVAGAAG
eukprot:751948-Rhodomonas_salina.1